MTKRTLLLILIIAAAAILSIYIYRQPTVQEHLGWRLDSLKANIKYALNPPQRVIFVPKSQQQENTPSPETAGSRA